MQKFHFGALIGLRSSQASAGTLMAFGAAIGIAAAVWPSAAMAQVVIDQQQTTVAAVSVGSTADGWNGQSFTPGATTSAGAGFLLSPTSRDESGTATVELWSATPGSYGRYLDLPTDAVKLATGSAILGDTAGWYDAFWAPVSVTPGAQYFLTFTAASTYNLNGNYDVYAAGQSYGGAGSDRGSYGTNGCCDLAFREYAAAPNVTTTPELPALALLGTGLIGVVPMFRRRKSLA